MIANSLNFNKTLNLDTVNSNKLDYKFGKAKKKNSAAEN